MLERCALERIVVMHLDCAWKFTKSEELTWRQIWNGCFLGYSVSGYPVLSRKAGTDRTGYLPTQYCPVVLSDKPSSHCCRCSGRMCITEQDNHEGIQAFPSQVSFVSPNPKHLNDSVTPQFHLALLGAFHVITPSFSPFELPYNPFVRKTSLSLVRRV